MEKKEKENYVVAKTISYFLLAVLVVVFLVGFFYTINAGERGVLLTLGKASDEIKQPGLHFKIPIIQTIKKMDVRTQKYSAEANSASKDLQIVDTKVAVNYSLEMSSVVDVYSDLEYSYEDRIIQPAIQEAVKSATAKYTAEELITQRPLVKNDISEIIRKRLDMKGLKTDEISITDFKFSDVFDQSIEAKVRAEQDALRAKNDLKRIKIEKEQKITNAEAQAERVKLEADAKAYKTKVEAEAQAEALELIRNQLMKSQELISYKYIEKWDGVVPKYMGAGEPIPFLDVKNIEGN